MVENKCGQIYFWTPLTALKENYSLTTATIGYGSCNFLFWGRNLMVSAFKWNLFSGTFALLSFSILQSKSKFLFSFYFVRRVKHVFKVYSAIFLFHVLSCSSRTSVFSKRLQPADFTWPHSFGQHFHVNGLACDALASHASRPSSATSRAEPIHGQFFLQLGF